MSEEARRSAGTAPGRGIRHCAAPAPLRPRRRDGARGRRGRRDPAPARTFGPVSILPLRGSHTGRAMFAARVVPPSVTLMSISACPSIQPSAPRSASARACSTIAGFRKRWNSKAISAILIGPPRNSPAVICQPIRDREDDPELDHEVRGGELEGDHRREVGALARQRAGERHCRRGSTMRQRPRGLWRGPVPRGVRRAVRASADC